MRGSRSTTLVASGTWQYVQTVNRTERALEAVSKAVREATWAFERKKLEVNVDDLPTPVIRKLSRNTRTAATLATSRLR
jgi:hypothetical protein